MGTNVASDALANLASGGVTGGALIIVGEDYGEGSSIMQERSHAFAMKSQIWLLDPRPNLPSIVEAVKKGFELSEASHTPVMLQLRIRACHVHGQFVAGANKRPEFTLKDALENPQRDVSRIVLPPASFLHEQEKVKERWPAALRFIEEQQLNEFFSADADDIGIIVQGGLYNALVRSLQQLGLADAFGEAEIPILCLNVTYPVVPEQVADFCFGKRAVLVVEEGQPVLAPEALAVQEVGGRAEHARLHRLGAVGAVDGQHLGRLLHRLQRRAVVAVLVGDRDAHRRLRGVALLGPQRAQQGVREHLRVQPLQLRGDHHRLLLVLEREQPRS